MAFLAPVRVRPFWATPLLSKRGKLRAMLEPVIPRSRGDLTVRAFLERRLGRELTEKVAEPLVSAIYGGDIDQLSIASALPDTYRTEQKHGSLWNGMRQNHRSGNSKLPFFMSLRSGMETLVNGLINALRDRVVIQTGADGIQIERRGGGFRVRDGADESLLRKHHFLRAGVGRGRSSPAHFRSQRFRARRHSLHLDVPDLPGLQALRVLASAARLWVCHTRKRVGGIRCLHLGEHQVRGSFVLKTRCCCAARSTTDAGQGPFVRTRKWPSRLTMNSGG